MDTRTRTAIPTASSRHPLLLLIMLGEAKAPLPDGLVETMRRVGCVARAPGCYEAELRADAEPALRELVFACDDAGGQAWVLSPLPAASDGPYQRLHDRSDQHAERVRRWRAGETGLPALRPGELVRL